MQHRANRNTRGRHRRTAALRSHRAPARPLAETGRYAAAVALAAGVGVSAVTAAAAGSASSSAGATMLSPGPAGAATTAAAPTGAGEMISAGGVTSADTTGTDGVTGADMTSADGVTGADTTGADGVTSAGASGTGGVTGAGISGTGGVSGAGAAGTGPVAARVGAPAGGLWSVPQARKAKPLPKWVNPLPEATVTSCFGPRWGRLHAGVDLAAANGTPIRAAGAGVVVTAGPAAGYGNAVLVDHGNGYLTHYAHMSAITVAAGQRVTAGDQLGNEGSTGHSTGPHLHFEVHQGSYQNPVEPTGWLREHGVDLPGCAS